jgi:LmbE family N-acetylglucosaminyl deacetylase
MRVLAVGAHPDDLEILCGGTLARFVREGHEVTMCHATAGDKGSFVHGRQEISRIRIAEAACAAEIAGARSECLGLADGEILASDPAQRRLVVALVRRVRPDLIITHHPGDYMSDHDEVSRLVTDCSFHATLPNFEADGPHHTIVPPIFFMETLMGLGFAPVEFVDIGETMETKVAMLEAHESQLTWLRDHDGIDVTEQMTVTARFRGQQCGVAYAEAFAPCLRWLRGTTRRLLP